ncbi:MAG: MBL fold metallo-hydrolase [Bryobacteraceae bacterium]|jgi:glyoxylase-like metal-dependent hydrolase (beta-lactamase superfamily II)
MPRTICVTCGTQYTNAEHPPGHCVICEDERQYVGLDGQQWTTLDGLRSTHRNRVEELEPGLTEFETEPKFGIGQRAFLLEAPRGNVLWDCLALLDDAAVRRIRERGGLSAIAISHPHYYTTMVEWSEAFGDVPIWLHEDDQRWVMRPDDRIRFWSGEARLLDDGLTLIRCGGHFDGGTVLHWPAGAGGSGVLLTGDVIQVTPDRRSVSFMYSYPNYIPLNSSAVRRIVAAVEPFAFDRIYGAFRHMTIAEGGMAAVHRSAARYLRAISD